MNLLAIGIYTMFYNGAIKVQNEPCAILQDEESITITSLTVDWYYLPERRFKWESSTEYPKGTLHNHASGRRMGGSVCGDGYDPLVGSIKQTLILTSGAIEMHESYRCLFSGKSDATYICQFKE